MSSQHHHVANTAVDTKDVFGNTASVASIPSSGSPAASAHIEYLKDNDDDAVSEDSRDILERRIRWKFHKRILPLAILLYFSAFLDRSNMGNARIMGLEEEIDLSGNRFNVVLTAFFVTYIIFDIPCNMVCKKIGPRLWLPFLCCGFGITTVGIAFVNSYTQLISLRALLGLFESGLLPGVIILLGRYYRRNEIATSLGWLSAVTSLSGAFGGLLATGFASIPSFGLMERWRWIFLLEGILTSMVGVVAIALLPNSPAEASWLTEEEKRVAIDRLAEEQKTYGNDPIDWETIKKALCYPPAHLIGIGLICSLCCMNSIALFMPTLLRAMGFTAVKAQLMTVPPYAWGAIVCISSATLSDRIRNRGFIMMGLACCIIVGFSILAATKAIGPRYFGVFLATTGGFCGSPLLLSWASDNAAGPAVRAVVSAYVISIGSFGALASTWTYRHKDAPYYLPGHYMNLGFGALMLVTVSALTTYLRWENRNRDNGKRDYRLRNPSAVGINRLGHLHPDFRYTP